MIRRWQLVGFESETTTWCLLCMATVEGEGYMDVETDPNGSPWYPILGVEVMTGRFTERCTRCSRALNDTADNAVRPSNDLRMAQKRKLHGA